MPSPKPDLLAQLQAAWLAAGTVTEPVVIPVGQEPTVPPRCRVHIDSAEWQGEPDRRRSWGGRIRVTCRLCGTYIGHAPADDPVWQGKTIPLDN